MTRTARILVTITAILGALLVAPAAQASKRAEGCVDMPEALASSSTIWGFQTRTGAALTLLGHAGPYRVWGVKPCQPFDPAHQNIKAPERVEVVSLRTCRTSRLGKWARQVETCHSMVFNVQMYGPFGQPWTPYV